MPHCILEYSANIKENPSTKDLLKRLNFFISENFNVDIKKIKSRLLKRDDYLVSNGENEQTFIHLEVAVLGGRERSTHVSLSKDLHDFLKKEFCATIEELPCSLTVEVRTIESDTYVRESFGAI